MRTFGLVFAACLALGGAAQAQVGSAVLKGGTELMEALGHHAARKGGGAIVEQAAARALGARLTGEALSNAAALVRRSGATALRALSGSPRPDRLVKLLDDLPADDAARALAALDRGAEGKALAESVDAFGGAVLKAELRHPGLADPIARGLGIGGLDAAAAGGAARARRLGALAQEAAMLPKGEHAKLLNVLSGKAEAFASFVERHPRFALSSVGAAFLLANSERILGGSEIVVDAQGVPHLVEKPGLLQGLWTTLWSAATPLLTPLVYAFAFVLAVAGLGRAVLKGRRGSA